MLLTFTSLYRKKSINVIFEFFFVTARRRRLLHYVINTTDKIAFIIGGCVWCMDLP